MAEASSSVSVHYYQLEMVATKFELDVLEDIGKEEANKFDNILNSLTALDAHDDKETRAKLCALLVEISKKRHFFDREINATKDKLETIRKLLSQLYLVQSVQDRKNDNHG